MAHEKSRAFLVYGKGRFYCFGYFSSKENQLSVFSFEKGKRNLEDFIFIIRCFYFEMLLF